MESYVHQQSEIDKTIFNYVKTVQSIDECEECQVKKKIRAEEDKIRKEEQKFQDSIEVLFELNDDSLSYEWSIAQVGKSPDGRFWYRYGSGCSCNYITDEKWEPLTNVAQLRIASRHISNAGNRARFIGDGQGLLSGI
jgi:hypothetical protein